MADPHVPQAGLLAATEHNGIIVDEPLPPASRFALSDGRPARDEDGAPPAADGDGPGAPGSSRPGDGAQPPSERAGQHRLRWTIRLALVLALLLLLGAIGRASGVRRLLRVTVLRERIGGLGAAAQLLGVCAFVCAFCVGELLQVPAPIFIMIAAVTWGRWLGALVAHVGALAAVVTSLLAVRLVGGERLGSRVPSRRLQRMLAELEHAPVRGVALIWACCWVVPYINYALALSPVTLREYVLGSALGLAPWTCGLAFAFDAALPLLERAGVVT